MLFNRPVGGRPLMTTRGQYLSISFAGMAVSLLLLAAFIPAAVAAAMTASRWETYTNTRYGVMIDYPADVFAIEPPPPDNAGRNFEAPNLKARFHVYTHANALDQTLQEIEDEDVTDLGDKDATKQNGGEWYQVLGVKDDEVPRPDVHHVVFDGLGRPRSAEDAYSSPLFGEGGHSVALKESGQNRWRNVVLAGSLGRHRLPGLRLQPSGALWREDRRDGTLRKKRVRF